MNTTRICLRYIYHDMYFSWQDSSNNFIFCTLFDTATYKAGIYDWAMQPRPYTQMMNPQPPPVYVIPGMKVGCMPYDAMIESNLECFFSAKCLNDTARWISSLPETAWPKPLNSSMIKRFLPTDVLRNIVNQQMIDSWQTQTNFWEYYTRCAPIQCTYLLTQRYTFIYLISLVISVYGSITVGLRLIAPWLAQLFQLISMRIFRQREKDDEVRDTQKGKTKHYGIYTYLKAKS
jgi:hypothetical protein